MSLPTPSHDLLVFLFRAVPESIFLLTSVPTLWRLWRTKNTREDTDFDSDFTANGPVDGAFEAFGTDRSLSDEVIENVERAEDGDDDEEREREPLLGIGKSRPRRERRGPQLLLWTKMVIRLALRARDSVC